MFRSNRSELVAPVKGDDKVRDIKQELSELGSIKAQYESDIKTGRELASTYEGLEEQVALKQKELELLQAEIVDYSVKSEEYQKLNKAISEKADIVVELDKKIKDLLNTESGLVKSVIKLSEDKSAKEKELQDSIAYHTDKLNSAKNDFIKWEKGAIAKVDEYDDALSAKKDELDRLAAEAIAGEKDLKSLTTKRAKLSSELEGLNISIEDAKKKLNDIMEVSDRYYDDKVAEFEEYKNSEVLKLQEREGEVSNRSKFLDVRENLLRDIKSQLEDKLGKKIDTVIF